MTRQIKLNRRQMLKAFAAAGAASVVSSAGRIPEAHAANPDARFLIVLPLFGGGAIIDSFLPLTRSECISPDTTDCFPDAEVKSVSGSAIRSADAMINSIIGLPLPEPTEISLSSFADAHRQHMMVTTLQATSVNHAIAQHRALTGGGAWSGRTLQEMVALTYGEGYPMPNVNMASLGYLQAGDDKSLPGFCYGEAVPDPLLKPLSLSARKGIKGLPPEELLALGRAMRDNKLDPESSFYQTFRKSERLQLWKAQRSGGAPGIENADLINKLIFVPDTPPAIPLLEYGLSPSEDAAMLAGVFPRLLPSGAEPNLDPLEQQAALAYLLLKNGVSTAVTLAPSFAPVLGGPLGITNPPLGFDGAHNDHRSTQAVMWQRCLTVADKLIKLLEQVPFGDSGETMWDRTMIHFATDFGRDKRRNDPEQWGTAHNLNNGTLTVSPLVNGNSVLGGVHKLESADEDGYTFGFNLQSGAADENRLTAESEHWAGLAQALGIDTSAAGLPDVPAMRKQ